MPMAYLIRQKFQRLASLSIFHKLCLFPVWLMLGLCRLVVLILPFRMLCRFIGVPVGVDTWLPIASQAQRKRATAIGQVIRLAARHAPWDANCFAQALTARAMLGFYKVPYALFFGVARDGLTTGLKAHAWVSTGQVRVTGGGGFSAYTVVGMFVSPRLLG